MRVALVVHSLPPHAHGGVETHTAALAEALVAEGVQVELFASRPLPGLIDLAQRREERAGWAVTWVNVPVQTPLADRPNGERDLADAFGAFLDRERPDVVHVRRLEGLGLGIVEEAKLRGLATVFEAHDYFALSESPTLLQPDLTPIEPGDREAEVRGWLARRALAEIDPDVARSGFLLPSELAGADLARVQRILHAPLTELGDLEDARERVKANLDRRRGAFAAFDARFASSRHLARKLSGTLGRAVDLRPSGFPLAPAEGGPDDGARPVRFGFLGPIDKPGGLHLALDAFSRLGGAAELIVRGDSEDRPYLRSCRARAREVGADWGGPIGPAGMGPLFDTFDVLVSPALWDEGPRFGLGLAFAAGRPVVAPRAETVEECVRDDVDGLLFDRGSVEDLARVMRRFVAEAELAGRLAGQIVPPRTIDAEARDWIDTYESIVALVQHRGAQPRLTPGFDEFLERHRELSDQPTRRLFDMVMNGLDVLGSQMGVKAGPRDFLAIAAGRGSRLRDGIVADRRAIDWLTRSVTDHEKARAELEESSRGHEAKLAELREQIGRLGVTVKGREKELATLEAQRDELQTSRDVAEAARAEIDASLEATRQTLESLERERTFLESTLEAGARELHLLRDRVAGASESEDGLSDREAIERHFASLVDELEGLREHEEFLRKEIGALVDSLDAQTGGGDGEELAGSLADGEVKEVLASGQSRLARLIHELGWRRREMSEARSSAQTLFARIAGGALASRVRRWSDPPAPVTTPEEDR